MVVFHILYCFGSLNIEMEIAFFCIFTYASDIYLRIDLNVRFMCVESETQRSSDI